MQGCAADPVYMKGEVFAYVGRNQNLKERKQGFSAEQVPVSAYGGSSKNSKDLKDRRIL